MNYLLDTCSISEYLKKKPSQKAIAWLDAQDNRNLYRSCLTIAKLNKGYYKLVSKTPEQGSQARAEKISLWISQLERRFKHRIIAIDSEMLKMWSQLCGTAEAKNQKLLVVDSLIVATAQTHSMAIVTRNVADFERCSQALDIFNPY